MVPIDRHICWHVLVCSRRSSDSYGSDSNIACSSAGLLSEQTTDMFCQPAGSLRCAAVHHLRHKSHSHASCHYIRFTFSPIHSSCFASKWQQALLRVVVTAQHYKEEGQHADPDSALLAACLPPCPAAVHAGEFVVNEFARIKYKQARLLGFKPPFVPSTPLQLRAKL